jgi:hypothetical protein
MIEENIANIRGRISAICAKLQRSPAEITIVAVSKNRTLEQVRQVVKAGITDIGENKVQEALAKYNEITNKRDNELRIKRHMVGHLQTNKVKEAVKIFDLIQSVDSLYLAEEIDKQAGKINKIQDILIEIKTSLEETKFGLKPDDVIEVIKEAAKLKNINIRGLMTVAPLVDNPEKSRPYFRQLRELMEKINQLRTMKHELRILSMGMTDDFEVAIEEGSNMVRLGRAIFEN